MKRSWKGKLAAVILAVSATTLVAVQPAAAAGESYLEEWTGYGQTYFWNTARVNYKVAAASFRMDLQDPGTGAAFTIGMRNAGGQFASASLYPGQTKYLTTGSGSTALPAGTFFLNTRVNGACGGSGCGLIHWAGLFRWDL